MIFADKLIILRKRHNMSQEELADKLNVTRQSISKWEGAQSVPDLQKVLQLSELFGVSTDVLLKDELQLDEENPQSAEPKSYCRKVSIEETNGYLAHAAATAKRYGIATGLCIFSVVPLLACLSKQVTEVIGQGIALLAGIILMFTVISLGVGTFIYSSFKNENYKFLDNTVFELQYGVKGILEERKKSYLPIFARNVIISVVLCILSVIPVIVVSVAFEEYVMWGIVVTVIIICVASSLSVYSGTRWNSLQKLLSEGEYTFEGKKANRLAEKISGIYWPLILTIYLGYSFISGNWGKSWIVWPVAAVFYAVVAGIVELAGGYKSSKEENDDHD